MDVIVPPFGVPDMLYVVMVVTYVVNENTLLYRAPCAGTLLRPNMVLTSEYCVMADAHSYPQPENIMIYDRLLHKLEAHMVFVRPRKVGERPELNLALVICEKTKIRIFPNLPTNYFSLNGNLCGIGGFGVYSDKPLVKDFAVNALDKGMMASCSPKNHTDMICLHLKTLMPCVGDVGSPLVCDDILHGLYAPKHFPFYFNDCVDRTETMFVPVYPALEWISKVQYSLDKSYPVWLTKPWAILLLSFLILLITACIYKALIFFVERRFSLSLRPDTEAPPRYTTHHAINTQQSYHRDSTPWGARIGSRIKIV